jgi:hypothetical protein
MESAWNPPWWGGDAALPVGDFFLRLECDILLWGWILEKKMESCEWRSERILYIDSIPFFFIFS